MNRGPLDMIDAGIAEYTRENLSQGLGLTVKLPEVIDQDLGEAITKLRG